MNDPTRMSYTEWDFKLIKAHYFLQDSMNGSFPIWIDESDRVTFDVKKKISKSRAALDRDEIATSKKKSYKPVPGQYTFAVPRTIDGGPMPSFLEWAEEQANKQGR